MKNEDLCNLGNLFKIKRKELSLSLKEAENATSIRAGYLEAIEEGCIDQFISSVYALGFIRQYASYLNFDIEELSKKVPGAFTIRPQKQEFTYGIGTLEMRGSLGGGIKWLPNLLWAGAAIGILTVAYFIAKFLDIL